MADSKVSALTAATALDGTELLLGVQAGASVKVTVDQVKTKANTSAVNAQTGTTYTVLNSDQNKLVTFNNAAAVAVTQPDPGGGNFAAGWAVSFKNLGAGTVTVTRGTSSTIDGATSFTLTTGQGTDEYSDGANFFTQPGKGSSGASGAAGGELQGTYPNPLLAYPNASGIGSAKRRFYVYNDFIAGSAALQTPEWSYSNGGTGTGYGIIDYGSTNAVGVLSLDLGTTTTGRSIVWGAVGGTPAKAITFGRGRARFVGKMAIHVLSNGTDTYTTRIGFIDSQTGSGTNAAAFRYTDSVNGGRWQAFTRDNTTETAADTGVTPVADTYQEFAIDVNAAGTSAVFSIDGAVVATITTNIPTTAGRQTSYGVLGLKSAGTTATSAGYVDYIEVQQDLTTAR